MRDEFTFGRVVGGLVIILLIILIVTIVFPKAKETSEETPVENTEIPAPAPAPESHESSVVSEQFTGDNPVETNGFGVAILSSLDPRWANSAGGV